ncbi:hypothetical protein [Sphingomonas sp. SRS2]|uniref:hypothetical protein n=1 Tax=Sphingomonas sp. SRS2 TaxID=133190 RepID=UPI000618468B|nr:hypothetical protein [Sphingomonas sp. SRS2]KKC24894.1 hypothetical protein WP12_16840 [Sphingomonas sp. SRS2]
MIIVIHGPPACGKTFNRERLREHFGCRRIVDSWDAYSGQGDGRSQRLRDGDLILTCDSPEAIYGSKALRGMSYGVHAFEAAIEAAGGRIS